MVYYIVAILLTTFYKELVAKYALLTNSKESTTAALVSMVNWPGTFKKPSQPYTRADFSISSSMAKAN